ncbi:hypothetical protein DAPPUDRAFT_264088 [Daphnia pulex]|uniref:GAG-pre-integrase domain-containing protein n=1 Tax=Daphnia pulex TaxID=6669 RepID=E9HQV4_DAPPU|nr:hypothetical protein DAPPUDRAFT_264088 [Daphnia pulex]|eukprot:EFX65881.1 hypothetical protein DAPPUDRAFT_264088 [Daphnia pulex]
MEVGQSKELDVVTIFSKPKEWETLQSKPMSTKNGIQTGISTSSPVASSSGTHKHRNHPKDGVREVGGLTIIKRSDTSAGPFCEGCALGKHHRLPFPTGGRKRANRIGELIHSDVRGPMSRPSPKGAKYLIQSFSENLDLKYGPVLEIKLDSKSKRLIIQAPSQVPRNFNLIKLFNSGVNKEVQQHQLVHQEDNTTANMNKMPQQNHAVAIWSNHHHTMIDSDMSFDGDLYAEHFNNPLPQSVFNPMPMENAEWQAAFLLKSSLSTFSMSKLLHHRLSKKMSRELREKG